MKIVLDNIVFTLQKSGGISTLWGELIKYLLSQKKEDVYFLEYKNNQKNIVRKELNIKQDKIVTQNINEVVKIERFRKVKLQHLKEKFIFSSSYYRTCSNRNSINVTIVHDFTHERFHKGFRKVIHSNQKYNAIKGSKGIICISENTKKDLLHYYPKIDSTKIKVIYNGVADHFYRIEKGISWKDIKEELHYLDEKKCVVFIGQRGGYKNFILAVKTFSLLSEDYHLVIIGGELSKNEKTFLNKILRYGSYSLLTDINNDILNKVYNNSFVLLYLSAYEGFGIPILEAMKTGTPVIAYNSSSIPEVVEDSGILLNKLDPDIIKSEILKFEDQEYYQYYVQKGLEQSAKFSWNKTMNQYLEYYQELYKKANEK